VYMNLAVLNMYEKRLDEALRNADEAVRLNPNLSLTHYYRGQVLDQLGRRSEAREAYARAVAVDPRDTDAQTALRASQLDGLMREGLDGLYRRRNPADAVERFRAVLAAMPTHYGATYQLARALDDAGRPAEALPLWRRMLTMAEASHDPPTIATCRERIARDQ